MITITDKEGVEHHFDWFVVEIDETESWRNDISEKCDVIYTVYLVNKTEVTNCCELTGSWWLEPLYVSEVPKDNLTDDEKDWLDNELMGTTLEGGYYHVGYKFNNEYDVNSSFEWDIEDTSLEEAIENLKEYLNCNHVM